MIGGVDDVVGLGGNEVVAVAESPCDGDAVHVCILSGLNIDIRVADEDDIGGVALHLFGEFEGGGRVGFAGGVGAVAQEVGEGPIGEIVLADGFCEFVGFVGEDG